MFLNYLKCCLLSVLILIGCAKIRLRPGMPMAEPSPNWLMAGGNPARTNSYAGTISLPLKLQWRYSASSAIGKTLLVVDGILYFATLDGRLYALDIRTGQKIGHTKTDVEATAVYLDSSLIIARRYGDETLFRYDLKSGKYQWKVDAGDIASEPLIFDQGIFLTALYKHIDQYQPERGIRIWQTKLPNQIQSSPAAHQDKIVFGCDDGFVYAVAKSTGSVVWKFKTSASIQATPAILDTMVYIGSRDGNFYALSLNDGHELWRYEVTGLILHGAAVDSRQVIFGTTDSKLYCLDRLTGHEQWTFTAKSVISTSPLLSSDLVLVGSLDHHYYALDRATGKELWRYKTKGRIRTQPIIWRNYLIGASENNYVYAFSSEKEF